MAAGKKVKKWEFLIAHSSQAGISLIEILLSVVLLGFIVLAINNVPNSIRLIGSTQQQSLAKDIASKQIEQLRLQTYANLSNGTTPIVDSRLSSLSQASGTVVIADCPISICTNNEATKQVTVNVSWNSDGQIKKITLSTMISSGGIR